MDSSSGSVRFCLAIAGLSFFGGLTVGRRSVQPDQTTVSHDLKQTQSKETKQRVIVTETHLKNGTVIKKTETDKEIAKVISKDDDTVKVEQVGAKTQTKYSLGLTYLPSLYTPPSMKDTSVDIGARLGNTDLWADIGYDVKHNQFSIGIRYEW